MKTEAAGAFDATDVLSGLSPEHEKAILQVVFRWATLDGAVSRLYVALHGLNDLESADEVSDQPTSVKLRALQLRMRPEAPTLATAFGRLKRQYEKYTPVRNTIAHCHCVGHLASDPDRAVFMRYRRIGDGLIVDAIHLDQFKEAVRFGAHLTKIVQRIDDGIRAEIEAPHR